jgi:sugar lactone lactonase YvrE
VWKAGAALAAWWLAGCAQPRPAAVDPPAQLQAEIIHSGFAEAHDTYNGISCASDGRVYYVLSSEKPDLGAQMYSYDPATRAVKHLGDLTEACGEKEAHAISQGKSHVRFVESGGKLYFSTHIGYYSILDGMEKPGIPPAGMRPYPGGHFLSYDMATGKYESLAIAPDREGIITFAMDTQRQRLYGITWPAGRFIRYDLPRHEMKDLGPVSGQGESGKGPAFRTICRSLAVDPDDGSVYFSTAEGVIHRYRYDAEVIETVRSDDLKKDYFGQYDPATAGSMAYNWRQTFWYAPGKAIYGVHGNSGYLFRFAPAVGQVEVMGRIASEPSQRSGMFDEFSYGYLGFALGPNDTIYYLTGGPIYENGRRVRGKESTAKGESKGREDLHLVTWQIPTGRYTDHGPIFFAGGQRPNYVNSIAVGRDGAVYALSRVSEDPHASTDLMRVPPVAVR